MKSLAQEISLAGRIEKITISEFRSKPGEVFASVALGKTFLVTQRGRTVAVVSKPPGVQLTMIANRSGKIEYDL